MADPVRITKVGGRFLVFEVKDVAALRRDHCICAVFVGTTPQNPNQSTFSGLPLELFPEEAALLVEKGAAVVVDDAAAHQAAIADPVARQAYLQSLRTRRRLFQKIADEQMVEKLRDGEEKKARNLARAQAKRAAAAAKQNKNPDAASAEDQDTDSGVDVSLFTPEHDSPPQQQQQQQQLTKQQAQPPPPSRGLPRTPLQHITPTTSADLLALAADDPAAHCVAPPVPRAYPLYKHLNARGFYMTPGIRFGADYSVYPGDPFRYHAHFMATCYEWDEPLAVLDLVTGGRLGTGVKKGFMIGGAPPRPPPKESGQEQEEKGDAVRAFTIEWAAM